MARFLVDTSCMVAALCHWHEHHGRAVREIARRRRDGEVVVAAAPALVETYAVLTRLPPPHRLSPAQCKVLLEDFFMSDAAEIAALDAQTYRALLQSAPPQGTAGGAIYDAVIIACAAVSGAEAVLTFNERQFRSLATSEIEIVVPA